MNIHYYKNFIKIAELGNISTASKTLLIAQPSLSKQIKTLETEFGTPLLKRNARNVELTTAGEIFYQKAKLICEINNTCYDEIHSNILGNKGKLKIGITISYPDWYIEDLFKNFSDLYPDITYDIREDSSDQLMNLLRKSIIEVALIRTPLHINPIFQSFGGIEENFMAVYHKNNPWLPQDVESISINQLRNVPLSISHGFKERVQQMFNEAGFEPKILSVNASRTTTLMWTRLGKAVGLVTTSSFKNLEITPTIICRPIAGINTIAQRSFVILKNANLSSVTKSFINFATDKTIF